jgi:hypothetical protein
MKPKNIDFHACSLALIRCDMRVSAGFMWLSMADSYGNNNEASGSVKAVEFII